MSFENCIRLSAHSLNLSSLQIREAFWTRLLIAPFLCRQYRFPICSVAYTTKKLTFTMVNMFDPLLKLERSWMSIVECNRQKAINKEPLKVNVIQSASDQNGGWEWETRAEPRSTLIPPKIKTRNGPPRRRTDERTRWVIGSVRATCQDEILVHCLLLQYGLIWLSYTFFL